MRKMIVILGLTLALVSLFGLTAAVSADPPPDCPQGQHYDQQAGQCVDNGNPNEATATAEPPTSEPPTAEPPTATAVPDQEPPTATAEEHESRAYCHANSGASEYTYHNNPAWVQHFENNGTPKAGHELDFFTWVGNTDCVRGDPTSTSVPPTATSVPPTATDTAVPTHTGTVEATFTNTPERPTTTATIERCDPGACATPTPKPPSHPGTGPEDSAAVLGWLVTMGIGLASAGIAGMRRR